MSQQGPSSLDTKKCLYNHMYLKQHYATDIDIGWSARFLIISYLSLVFLSSEKDFNCLLNQYGETNSHKICFVNFSAGSVNLLLIFELFSNSNDHVDNTAVNAHVLCKVCGRSGVQILDWV